MKKCLFCGFENSGDATYCQQCGTNQFEGNASAKPPVSWVLHSEVEAERMDLELTNRNIPHLLHSFHDSALDGLYQLARGWGQVEAPAEFKDAVLAILNDIREQPAAPETPTSRNEAP